MAKFIIKNRASNKISVVDADSEPIVDDDGNTIEYDEVEEAYVCDDHARLEARPTREIIMIGVFINTDTTKICKICGKVATKLIKKYKKLL